MLFEKPKPLIREDLEKIIRLFYLDNGIFVNSQYYLSSWLELLGEEFFSEICSLPISRVEELHQLFARKIYSETLSRGLELPFNLDPLSFSEVFALVIDGNRLNLNLSPFGAELMRALPEGEEKKKEPALFSEDHSEVLFSS